MRKLYCSFPPHLLPKLLQFLHRSHPAPSAAADLEMRQGRPHGKNATPRWYPSRAAWDGAEITLTPLSRTKTHGAAEEEAPAGARMAPATQGVLKGNHTGGFLSSNLSSGTATLLLLSLEVTPGPLSFCSTTTNRDNKGDGLTAPAVGLQVQPVWGLLGKIL